MNTFDEHRTCGLDLPNEVVARVFYDNIPASQLHPKTLWRAKIQRSKGKTSDWRACEKAYNVLTNLADESKGRVPKQKQLHLQFVEFLSRREITWCYRDSDDAITGLRVMFQTCLEIKRSDHPVAPANHPRLQIIIDKMYVAPRSEKNDQRVCVRSANAKRVRSRSSDHSSLPQRHRRKSSRRSPSGRRGRSTGHRGRSRKRSRSSLSRSRSRSRSRPRIAIQDCESDDPFANPPPSAPMWLPLHKIIEYIDIYDFMFKFLMFHKIILCKCIFHLIFLDSIFMICNCSYHLSITIFAFPFCKSLLTTFIDDIQHISSYSTKYK